MTAPLVAQEDSAVYRALRRSDAAHWPWNLPPTWRWERIGDMAQIVGGGTPSTQVASHFGGDIPWITPADLSGYSAKHIARGARNLSADGLAKSGARLMPAGAVLFSSRAPIGYVAIASNPIATNQGFKSFVLSSELLSGFVYYWLQVAKPMAVALASGTTFLEVSGKKISQLPVPIAPLAAQRAVVDYLDEQLSRLDASVAALHRVQANLKRYRASVLKAACEGRLVPTEAELAHQQARDYESGAHLLERVLNERTRGSDSARRRQVPSTIGVSAVELASGWTRACLDELCEPIVDCPHSTARFQASGYPCIDTNWMSRDGLLIERARYVGAATYSERISRLWYQWLATSFSLERERSGRP